MIHIDDLNIELLMPDVLMNYLASQGIYEVFDVINDEYYLNNNSDEHNKNVILNSCLSLLSNDISDCVSENETLLSEYQKVCSGIQYIDSSSNDKIIRKIKDLMEFKERIKDYNLDDGSLNY